MRLPHFCFAITLFVSIITVTGDDLKRKVEWNSNEFEGFDDSVANGGYKQPTSPPKSPFQQQYPRGVHGSPGTEYRQIVVGCVLGIASFVGITFLIGMHRNAQIANAWANEFVPHLSKHFGTVGLGSITPTSGVKRGQDCLVRTSFNVFTLRASGRRHCRGLIAEIRLRPRHNFFLWIYKLLQKKGGDYVLLDFPVADLPPFVFAVFDKSSAKERHRALPDLKQFARPVASGLPAQFTVLSDTEEVVPVILCSQVLHTLATCGRRFHAMHFSDRNVVSRLGADSITSQALRFYFHLPSSSSPSAEDTEELTRLTNMALWLVDTVATDIQLSAAARTRALRARESSTAAFSRQQHKIRSADWETRKREERRAQEEKYATMTKKQKRAHDLAEDKRQQARSRKR